jgi:hypothetical protein
MKNERLRVMIGWCIEYRIPGMCKFAEKKEAIRDWRKCP